MSDIHQIVHEHLDNSETTYVLITCKGPKKDGTMDVQMTHQGDEMLISYLLDGAQSRLEEQEEDQSLYC
ncbi:MAG: hypothetical protein H7A37_08565 [Chlamydiales bacterium]|nr:hypothetical protein [Chlamydiia bacterium]MCP5508331.1 hypothetical protein [Chlamydiales bacterium]